MTPNADYVQSATGWSASMNSAVFYSCTRCGACVVEIGRSDHRSAHNAWHAQIDGSGT